MIRGLSNKELRILAYTLLGEAAGEGKKGMEAVAHVIFNRANSGRFPSNPAAVALQKNQFSTWNAVGNGGNEPTKHYSSSSAIFKTALRIVSDVAAGKSTDPTFGATHFATADKKPTWFDSEAPAGEVQIGNHMFGKRIAEVQSVRPTATGSLPAAPRVTGEGLTIRSVKSVPVDPLTGKPIFSAVPTGVTSKVLAPPGVPTGTQLDPSAPVGAGNAGQPSGFGVGTPEPRLKPGAPLGLPGGLFGINQEGVAQRAMLGKTPVLLPRHDPRTANTGGFDLGSLWNDTVKIVQGAATAAGDALNTAGSTVVAATKDPRLKLLAMFTPSTEGTLEDRATGRVGPAAQGGSSGLTGAAPDYGQPKTYMSTADWIAGGSRPGDFVVKNGVPTLV